jgi:Uma2 family endonuclease
LWIVDLTKGQLESFRSPGPDGYRDVRQVSVGHVAPLAFPEVALAVDDILMR